MFQVGPTKWRQTENIDTNYTKDSSNQQRKRQVGPTFIKLHEKWQKLKQNCENPKTGLLRCLMF